MSRISRTFQALTVCLALALPLVGCGQDLPASQDTDVATSSAEFTPAPLEENHLADELASAMEQAHDYDSVTVTESTYLSMEAGEDPLDTDPSSRAVKFDFSGDTVRSCSSMDLFGDVLLTFVEGDEARLVMDGEVYGGTVEELSLHEMLGVDEFLDERVGSFQSICGCAKDVSRDEDADGVTYSVTVDPALYVTQNEEWAGMTEEGVILEEYVVDYRFGTDGRLTQAGSKEVNNYYSCVNEFEFKDYDATDVDPMPEATKPASEFKLF